MKTNPFIHSLALTFAATVLSLPSAINPCLAQLPAPIVSPAIPVNARWFKIPVKKAIPSDIVATMHWNDPAHLPEGVTKVYALDTDGSVFLQATVDGFNKLRETVRALDVMASIAQVKIQYARVPIAVVQSSGITFSTFPMLPTIPSDHPLLPSPMDPKNEVQIASGDKVAALLSSLKQKKIPIVDLPVVSLHNNFATRVNIWQESVVRITFLPHILQDQTATFDITPVIHGNPDTVQNELDADLKTPALSGIVSSNPEILQEGWKQVTVTEPVTNGKPILITGLNILGQTHYLVFITPTLLPNAPADSMTKDTPSEGVNP